ncbi:MAG: uroporphyrinogen decarboxylase, partial [Alphaproteobacteria bacterium]|nr:uroporphyrinogen decarboxylase [Alphaproteobacteria bacterium]
MSEHPADLVDQPGPDSGKPLIDALQGRASDRPPLWLMRQAGRYLPEYQALRKQAETFIEFCLSPDLAVEATLQPLRRYRLNAAILFSDILVIPYALGQAVGFEQGEGPRLEPVRDAEAIDALEMDGLVDRLGPVYEAARRVSKALEPGVTFIGFAGAPWTVATYMVEGGTSRDFTMVKRLAFGDPHGFAKLMDVLTEATIAHLLAQIEAGAEVVQVFDSWAGVLSETDFERFAIEPMRRIVDRIKDSARPVPVIGFPRG